MNIKDNYISALFLEHVGNLERIMFWFFAKNCD